jgi:hypothetical protein
MGDTTTQPAAAGNVAVPWCTPFQINLPPPHDDFSSAVVRRWKDIDLDGDGVITKQEVAIALQNTEFPPKFAGADGAMIATLWKMLADAQTLQFDQTSYRWRPDGLTMADITAYDRNRLRSIGSDVDRIIDDIQYWFAYGKQKIATTPRVVFIDGDEPDVTQVKQALVGDCWLLAALVALGLSGGEMFTSPAYGRLHREDPGKIRALFLDAGGDGPYTVKFPGNPNPIRVSKPSDAEVALFSSANGMWLSILEKAQGVALGMGSLDCNKESDVDRADIGDETGAGIQLLTGHDCSTVTTDVGNKQLREMMQTAAFGNKLMTCAIADASPRDNGLPTGHGYTVIYAPDKNVALVRNPWGDKTQDYGEWSEWGMDDDPRSRHKHFYSNFDAIAFEV